METKVLNLLSGNTGIVNRKVKPTANYYVKGYNNKGVCNFQLSKQLEYDKTLIYDIETVKFGVDYNKLHKSQTLDLRTNIMYSFSLLVPKSPTFFKQIKKFKEEEFREIKDYEFNEIYDLQETEEYILIFYGNDFDNGKVLELLVNLLNVFSKKDKTKKIDNKTSSTLKIIGFNNNKFDDLIFQHYPYANIFTDNINKLNKIELPLLGHNLKLISFDSKSLSKNFGAFNLASLGKEMKLDKLDISNEEDTTIEEKIVTNIKYNNRDNEIVYKFIKFINEDMGIYQTNIASWTRKYFYKTILEKTGVDNIQVSKYINRFRLYGGRTEAYTHLQEKDIFYIDYNSLYTSASVCLDMAEPQITMIKDKKVLDFKIQKVRALNNFYDLIMLTENFLLEKNKFSYKDLADNYSSPYFYMGKFKITGINPLFSKYRELLEFYFPFVSKINDKSSFSFNSDTVYEIGFYEILFLTLFDFEIVELFEIEKGNDLLKEEKIKIYEDRKELKKQGSKLEKLEKIKLNSGYGIFATKNIESQIILDNKIIETLDNMSDTVENKDKKEIWEMFKKQGYKFQIGNDLVDIKNIGDYYYMEKPKSGQKWTGNSLPIIGLNIVSNARFMMFSIYLDYILNMNANISNPEIYYTDTDSLFCSGRLYDRLNEVGLVGNELGQLKNEYPDNEIEYLKCFAPKTYIYKLVGEDKPHIVFKGTGTDTKRDIIIQSVKSKFNVVERIALIPEKEQKRTLKDNKFENHFGVSEELIKVWNEYIKG